MRGGIDIEVIEDRPYDEIIDESCPSCRMAVPGGTTTCPNCGYAMARVKKAAKPEKGKPVKAKKDSTNAVNAALIIFLALLSIISAGVYPVMAIPVGLLAVVLLVVSLN